jgi:hypothetical protein
MKLSILIALLISLPCSAAKNQQGYLLKTKLNFKENNQTVVTEGSLIIAKGTDIWVALNKAEKGIILLGRKRPSQEDIFEMEFLVINTSNMVIHQSRIISRLGKEAEITTDYADNTGKPFGSIAIKLLAKRINYETED